MFSFITRKLLKSPNEKLLKKITPIIQHINSLESDLIKLSDEQLREQTSLLRKKFGNVDEEEFLSQAFATVREASKRVLNKRHYDVQLMGGIVMHRGMIAEMRTGEGKTLAATLPAYFNALSGKGVHVITVNDYLVARDAEWMGAIYKFLDLEIGYIVSNMNENAKKNAYNADITYGTNNEFGFDYLRDNLKYSRENMVQRPFNYAIVDEVDSILIDEARTPLIISGKTDDDPNVYNVINKVVKKLSANDYELDEKLRNVLLTDDGTHNLEEILRKGKIIEKDSSLYDFQNLMVLHTVNQSLKAHTLFKKDVDYMVRDNKIFIIDEFTGRIMEGRRYSDGLHQAIEAKEDVTIQSENQTIASITFQNFFRMYPRISGMTGTAMKEATELAEIYGLQVVSIPTNLLIKCVHDEDVVYRTAKEKYKAIINEIKSANKKQQPVLVGTVSVEKSELISSILKKEGIKHNVLNAKQHAMEAEVIGQAGRLKAVTIATNMAGRGTDIILGGNTEMIARGNLKKQHNTTAEESPELFKKILSETEQKLSMEQEIVKNAGGLLVIGTERHESRRIDDQLRGRSGRQGDNGRSKFFLSMEDDLMRLFGSEKISNLLVKIGLKEGEAIEHRWVTQSLEKAQQKVEERNYEIRKNLLQYDDVMNEQRKIIYAKRNHIIGNPEDLLKVMPQIFDRINKELIETFLLNNEPDIDTFEKEVENLYSINDISSLFSQDEEYDHKKQTKTILQHIERKASKIIDEKMNQVDESDFYSFLQHIAILTLDHLWKDHLHTLDQLRTGINLRSYGQKNPLMEYKNEAFNLFKEMLSHFELQFIERIFKTHFVVNNQINKEPTQQNNDKVMISRNQLCHCGSGKRYKHCHGVVV